MFGFSFGELVVLVIVGMVVLGPKELPVVLRKLGQWSGKLRRMASEVRAQSGIDEMLRSDGIGENIAELRKLARGELDQISRAATVDLRGDPRALPAHRGSAGVAGHDPYGNVEMVPIVREREYPCEGADSYKAISDTAIVYAETLPSSALASDPLYMTGDSAGIVNAIADANADANANANADANGEPSHP